MAIGQRAAVGNELADRRVEGAQEPHIEHQEQQLGADHPAPALEDPRGGFRRAHGVGKRRGIAENAHEHIPLHSFQKQFEVVPGQGDHQDNQKDQADHRGY